MSAWFRDGLFVAASYGKSKSFQMFEIGNKIYDNFQDFQMVLFYFYFFIRKGRFKSFPAWLLYIYELVFYFYQYNYSIFLFFLFSTES